MVSRVEQWGNGQGVRLPQDVLEQADIAIGDDVEIVFQGSQIVIRKVTRKKFDLAEMVVRMPHDYEVREESFGEPKGREEW